MGYDNSPEKRVEIFEDTMRLCRENQKLAAAVKYSRENTKFYGADEYPQVNSGGKSGKISVTAERTLQAAKRLTSEYAGKKIAVLNFASATNPGGGVTKGSSAQEEAICRCSTLYPCLNTKELFGQFYGMHRARSDVRYTDCCIYTPSVFSIKSDTNVPEAVPEGEWFSVDVITCAAPNLRPKPYNAMNPGQGKAARVTPTELLAIHKKRGAHILDIAAANGAEVLVLGAFGCGAFRNDPQVVARAYKEILADKAEMFDEVTFAVYCSPRETGNYDTFKRVLS